MPPRYRMGKRQCFDKLSMSGFLFDPNNRSS
jgi:hypothetical protein